MCKKKWVLFLSIVITIVCWNGAIAASLPIQSKGQTVFVPVYSHIYSGNAERPFYLAVTLSIRNPNLGQSITITSVEYYSSIGKRLKIYVDEPVRLDPLSAMRYVISESDKAGGSGASFVVNWESSKAVTAPLIETVMISTRSKQGISFTSRGVVVAER